MVKIGRDEKITITKPKEEERRACLAYAVSFDNDDATFWKCDKEEGHQGLHSFDEHLMLSDIFRVKKG